MAKLQGMRIRIKTSYIKLETKDHKRLPEDISDIKN